MLLNVFWLHQETNLYSGKTSLVKRHSMQFALMEKVGNWSTAFLTGTAYPLTFKVHYNHNKEN